LQIEIYIVILRLNNKTKMGLAKSEIFTDQQNQIAVFAKVFGHPARVAILQHLFKIEGCICGDLVNEIGLAQPTISQHLKELKNLGLIKGNVEGTSVCYCIEPENWSKMKEIMSEFLNQDIPKADCC
jgi:DNA-binding transcriptional ArsR family regulator